MVMIGSRQPAHVFAFMRVYREFIDQLTQRICRDVYKLAGFVVAAADDDGAQDRHTIQRLR
jgi:hypothetical protein